MDGGMPVARNDFAQRGRDGIDQAALHARGRGHEFALARENVALAIIKGQRHRLERLAGKALGEIGAPAARRLGLAPSSSAMNSRRSICPPGAAPPRPTSNPQLEGFNAATSTPRCSSQGIQAPSEPSRAQLPPPSASTTAFACTCSRPSGYQSPAHRHPANPASGGACAGPRPGSADAPARHAARAQPSCPGEYAARTAHKGFHAQLAGPGTQLIRGSSSSQRETSALRSP